MELWIPFTTLLPQSVTDVAGVLHELGSKFLPSHSWSFHTDLEPSLTQENKTIFRYLFPTFIYRRSSNVKLDL